MTVIRYFLQLLILLGTASALWSIYNNPQASITEAIGALMVGSFFFIMTLMLREMTLNRRNPLRRRNPRYFALWFGLLGGLVCWLGWRVLQGEPLERNRGRRDALVNLYELIGPTPVAIGLALFGLWLILKSFKVWRSRPQF